MKAVTVSPDARLKINTYASFGVPPDLLSATELFLAVNTESACCLHDVGKREIIYIFGRAFLGY